MKHYPYRTTYDKIPDAFARVQASGDSVLSTHFVGGRDWVLICRSPAAAEVARPCLCQRSA